MARSDDLKTQFIVTLPSKTEKEEEHADEIHTHRRTYIWGKSRTQEAHTAKREAVSFGTHWQRWSGPAEEKRQNFYWWPGICSTAAAP